MTKLLFDKPVMNRAGYVVMVPGINEMADMLGGVDPNPYGESSTQLWPLGTKLIQGERVWRYCKNGSTALDIAAPLQQAKAVHAEQDDDIVVGAASAIGATTVTLTSTANLDGAPNNVANDFAEGYLIVNDAAGEGQLYKIKSNAALVTTGNSIFTLYDALTIALTTSSQCGLVRNPYYKVIATEAVVSGMFVGVPLIAVTASYWFWSQTGGPAPGVAQAAIVLGSPVVVGVTAAKFDPATVAAGGAGGEAIIQLEVGYAMTPGVADTESFIVFLENDR